MNSANDKAKHIVADDNTINNFVIRMSLEPNGIIVESAENGNEVIKIINSDCGFEYNVIWMDIDMPIMDGIECTVKLRKDNYSGYIVGVTSHNDENTIKKCLESGMNEVLAKPFFDEDVDAILCRIKNQ